MDERPSQWFLQIPSPQLLVHLLEAMEMVSVDIMMQLMNLKQRQLEMLNAMPSAQIMERISN